MAKTNKTNTNKATTKKVAASKTLKVTKEVVEPEVVEDEVEVVEDEPEVVEEAPVVKVEKREFHSDDMITCRSTSSGKVVMEGDLSKNIYRWIEYGGVCDVEYRDLVNAVRRHSSYLFTPRIVVDDEDFVNSFPDLKKFYNEQFTINELTDIINMNNSDIVSAVKILPKGAKEELTTLVADHIANGAIDSIKKIKTFEDVLGVDFSMVADAQ